MDIRRYAAFLLLLLASTIVRATHIGGGEIYWDHLGGNQYRITLIVYRDCAGVTLDNGYNLDITSPCGTMQLWVDNQGTTEVSQLCGAQLPNSTCNGGTLPGIQRRVYTGTVNLPPCDSWTISWTEIYRNNAIVNLQTPGSQEVYIEGVLNNAAGPANDSPLFSNTTAVPYVCLGYPVSYSYGAYDPEADSLSYEFIEARHAGAVPIPYVAPYTGTQPITGITLDPATGLVNFTLNMAGNWVVIVKVNEYDSAGNLIGSIMRDMQFIAYPCNNAPPDPASGTVGGVSGTAVQTAPYAIRMCESGTACFDMVITDPNPANVLQATSNIAANLPGATFSYTGTNPIQCHVCWNGGQGTAGYYPFIVNVNDGACPIVGIQTYVYTVEVIEGVFIDVSTSPESCAGQCDGSATASVVSGTGPFTYAWDNGATSNPLTACAGTYVVTVTDANGCVTTPAQAVIDGSTPPTADGGPDVSVCYGQWPIAMTGTATNSAATGWSGGTGLWSGTGSTMYYTPSVAEVTAGGADVVFTATGNGGCPDATDQVHIILSNSYISAAITPTNITCNGAATGSATYAPDLPGNTYVWNAVPPQTAATASGLMAGNYSVTVTDAQGCTATMSTTITQPAALVITGVNATDETCAGQGNGTLVASASGGTGGQQNYVYNWSNGATGQTITVGAGTYSVTVTDANGCTSAAAQGTVNSAALPNAADAGNDAMVCMNDFPIALSGSVQNATGGQWSGGTGSFAGQTPSTFYTPSAAEVAAGYVDLVLTTTGNTGCPPASDQVHILISNSFLNAAVSTTPILCNGGSTGTAAFSPAQPVYGYQWSPSGQNGPVATGLSGGTHTVTVTDQLGCDTVMSVSLIDPPTLTVTAAQSTGPLCANGTNGSITLSVTGGTAPYTYQWSTNAGGQTTATANNLGAGAYQVTVTDANGCIAQASATLTAPAPIMLTAQVPDTVCVNTPIQLTAQVSGGTGATTIYWGGIGYGPSMQYSFPTSQIVSVSATDAVGCTSPILTFPVNVLDLNAATLVMSNDTTVCPGGTAQVSAAVNNYPGAINIQWTELVTTGTGPFNVPVSNTQTLHVLVTNTCGQMLNGDVTLTLEVPPQITLPPVLAVGCAPLTVQFPDSLTTQNVTWLWNFGDGTTSTAPAPVHTYAPGSYTVSLQVATPAGCTANAQNTSSVTAYQGPTASFGASTYQTDMDAPTITFTSTSAGAINGYAWEFGDGDTSNTDNPVHTYAAVGNYPVQLVVTDVNGCSDTANTGINVIPVYDIDIPTAFTPDPNGNNNGVFDPNDMSNDVFYPIARFVKEFQMRVWNRWGELVFESNEVNKGWNGFYRGRLSPQDVYVYHAKIRFVDDRVAERNGDITLLR